MPGVAGAAGIQREVSLEILQPGHERTVQGDTQLVELREQPLLGVEFRFGQPGDEIATHLRRKSLARAPTDARGTQRTLLLECAATRAQVVEQACVHEIVDHAEAARSELLG